MNSERRRINFQKNSISQDHKKVSTKDTKLYKRFSFSCPENVPLFLNGRRLERWHILSCKRSSLIFLENLEVQTVWCARAQYTLYSSQTVQAGKSSDCKTVICYFHTVILSDCQNAIMSHCQNVIMSLCQTVIMSYCKPVIMSLCHNGQNPKCSH